MPRALQKLLLYLSQLLKRDELAVLHRLIHQRLITATKRTHEQDQCGYWERLADRWEDVTSPFRPSSGDISVYREFLTKTRGVGPVLILGSTPELRDLAATAGAGRVHLADFSYRMPLAMLRFTKHVDPREEIWVRANWLELPFPQEFFGAILGDLTLQQLTPEAEPRLLGKVATLLRPGGVFITRCQVLDETVLGDDIGAIVARFRGRPLTDWQKVYFIASRLLWRFADRTLRQLNRTLASQKLAAWADATGTTHPLLARIRQAILEDPAAFRTWSPPGERELVTLFSKYFTVVETKRANDYEGAEWCPIFLLGITDHPKTRYGSSEVENH
ncbi:class I SAM-dependent methyltransferase [Candidatus Parcubacteria bacterium]|nr:class I SAM-dependent methyltransferase [Candidatus Parcubacteria bacterium]